MKQIEHDPEEHTPRKFPDYGEKRWAREKYGREPTPSDFWYFILPIAFASIALFLWRGY